jgi:hypothetical protein
MAKIVRVSQCQGRRPASRSTGPALKVSYRQETIIDEPNPKKANDGYKDHREKYNVRQSVPVTIACTFHVVFLPSLIRPLGRDARPSQSESFPSRKPPDTPRDSIPCALATRTVWVGRTTWRLRSLATVYDSELTHTLGQTLGPNPVGNDA